jgi:CLIP-associating protein 1/2
MQASSSRLTTPKTGRGGSAVSAGSVSDEQFKAAFEAVPPFKFTSTKDLITQSQRISSTLENTVDGDWNKRMKELQMLRSILLHGGCENAEFVNQVTQLFGQAILKSVTDLRSQVCREACITIGYFSERLGTNFWKIAEMILPTTLNLMQNSAKVMASSGVNANQYIAKHVQHPRILQLILGACSSKSKDIRRNVGNLIEIVISNWDAHALEKHWPEILPVLKAAVYDADEGVRKNSRQTYEVLQSLFPSIAEQLFNVRFLYYILIYCEFV